MKRILCALILCVLPCFGGSQLSRQSLSKNEEIQGYECTRGYAWLYPDGKLETCSVSKETNFGEVRVPPGSMIHILNDGRPKFVFLSRDTRLVGLTCRGGGHDYMTGLYPSGKLKLCWLAGDQDVQGVPCMGAGFIADVFGGGAGTWFWENGKLRTCKPSQDYGNLHRSQHIVLPNAP